MAAHLRLEREGAAIGLRGVLHAHARADGREGVQAHLGRRHPHARLREHAQEARLLEQRALAGRVGAEEELQVAQRGDGDVVGLHGHRCARERVLAAVHGVEAPRDAQHACAGGARQPCASGLANEMQLACKYVPVCAQITGRQNAACSFCACMYAT